MPRVPALRRIRESRVLTQAELAKRAGVHEITISKLEGGANARPSTIRSLARALHVKPEALLEEAPIDQ